MIQGFHMVTFGLLLSLIGCDAGPQLTVIEHPVSAEIRASFEPLEGYWEIKPVLTTDCPSEWQRMMPVGQTYWELGHDDALTIEAAFSSSSPVTLIPTDTQTLERESVVTAYGCQVTESLTLVIDQSSPYAAAGLFTARLSHDGSSDCLELAAEAGLPAQCETIVDWRARRTSPY